MQKLTGYLLLGTVFFLLLQCSKGNAPVEKHIFYLHGRIIEEQGPNAVSEKYGPYAYTAIIDSLKATGAVVHHELRTQETDFYQFAEHTSAQIDSLLAGGVDPRDITLIGASKGAVMTMYIAHSNPAPINYVLLGANNDYIEQEYDWHLHGHILAVYERSDAVAGKNYDHWVANSPEVADFRQLEINTGLDHGFLYRPIDAWWQPAKAWVGRAVDAPSDK